MKRALTSRARRDAGRLGVALVMTLVALAVLMVLLLAFLAGASHQIVMAQNSGVTAREQMLADSAVALVIGQIATASTQTNQAWISQPGLLRTYAATAARIPSACYKTYSAPQMVDTNGNLAFVTNDIPANWSALSNAYTDLNAPVSASDTTTIYPIFDPAAVTNVTGMSVDSGHVAEMPVAWIYQLQDGTLGSMTNATAANPIVGRIAFWTDDETSKVNINTAASGSAWQVPHCNSSDDVTWSSNQPAAGEYSAYPGHPATTTLASIFGTNSYTPQQLLALTPRYAWGGSQGGTVATTPGETLAPKTNRLYGSVDELAFGPGLDGAGNRQTNAVSAAQLEWARFFLAAHSEAPETTLLGEPRIAIWPVAGSTSAGAPRLTAFDRAVTNVATVGDGTTNVRSYFFQRNDPGNATNDLTTIASNAQLFSNLVARGTTAEPGYGTSLGAKYSGAAWTQLALEMVDFIRGLNAIDPSPAPFVPFAGTNSVGAGEGFIVPLTTAYGTGTNPLTLRGMGRCPTLSSLTLVLYVSGFGLKNGTTIDYDGMDPATAATSWNANFAVGSPTSQWKNVKSELVRAFVAPCTFQPGCGFPEVSDACDIQISGLNGISVTSGAASGSFGFAATANSRLLSDALTVLPAERAWGGNEGPLAWRAAAVDALASMTWNAYPFAGTNAFVLPLPAGAPTDSLTGGPSLPTSWSAPITFTGVTGLTVNIRDRNGVTLQTLSVGLPAFTAHAPTINGECDHLDGSTPATANTAWASTTSDAVVPSYYMSLRNRILATQNSRAVMIQAGDVARGVEAATDLRIIAGLASVPSTLFHPHPYYNSTATDAQMGSHAHNIRFADGTSACFAPGEFSPLSSAKSAMTRPVNSAAYANATNVVPVHDWRTGALLTADPVTQIVPYTQFTSAPCSVPTSTNGVTMVPPQGGTAAQNVNGDWDTGPGFSADGAQVNLPDAGTSLAANLAYFSLGSGQVGAATQRTPNALVPSPVIFGSLPAGINPAAPAQSQPWRTLLFCPYPAADTAHPGFGNTNAATPVAPDHLVLDNFWMPVIEPYAISTRLATGGKVNLNDQIVPFTYLHRSTALHAVLNNLRIPAISASSAAGYKSAGTPLVSIWNPVDETATIAQIENRFANGSADAYLSESEICTVPLVPQGLAGATVAATQTTLDAYWNGSSGGGRLTGDNLRELPYAQLYGRLATRSNSYTVHVRVQVLQKLPGDPAQNVWKEGTDLVLGEWRGSYEIERYLDPTAPAPVSGQPLAPYKFRIVSARRFSP